MVAYLDAHYAIVSIPLLVVFCVTVLLGNMLFAFLYRTQFVRPGGWVRRGLLAALDQCFGAIGIFTLGYFFWRVL